MWPVQRSVKMTISFPTMMSDLKDQINEAIDAGLLSEAKTVRMKLRSKEAVPSGHRHLHFARNLPCAELTSNTVSRLVDSLQSMLTRAEIAGNRGVTEFRLTFFDARKGPVTEFVSD